MNSKNTKAELLEKISRLEEENGHLAEKMEKLKEGTSDLQRRFTELEKEYKRQAQHIREYERAILCKFKEGGAFL